MTIAIICTIMSAVCMAIMIILDRIMVGDCYEGDSNQAWFVSSFMGSISGLILTAFVWCGAVFLGKVDNLEILFQAVGDIAVWRGLAMVIVGALGVQILLHYFRCFSEDAHSAVIAVWLASTPLFIYLAMLFLTVFVNIEGLSTTSTDIVWFVGIFIATVGIIWFERLTNDNGNINAKKYRKELIILLLLNVIYTVVLKQVLGFSQGKDTELVEILALMPFYWIGFGAGVRIIFAKGEWQTFKSNWGRNIKYFFIPILIIEVIGMLVFFFEYFGLTELDPAFVSIIVGAHIFLVYVLNLILGRLRSRMERKKINQLHFLGVRLTADKLPHPSVGSKIIALEVTAMTVAVIGIVISSMSSVF